MSKQILKGRGKQVKGKVREELAKVTGNRKAQLKGKTEQAEGRMRAGAGKVTRKIRKL